MMIFTAVPATIRLSAALAMIILPVAMMPIPMFLPKAMVAIRFMIRQNNLLCNLPM